MPPADGARSRSMDAGTAAPRCSSRRSSARRDAGMTYVALVAVAALALFLALRAFVHADPARLARHLKIGALVAVGLLIPLVLLAEGAPFALFMLPPMLFGARTLWRR